MEKEEITISNLVTVAGMTIVAIAKASLNASHGKQGTAFFGSIRPESVIIITPQGKRAFRITGEEVTLEQLTQEFPDISEKLEAVSYLPI
jgi:uncharacterized spore protein YtfJ